MHPDAAQKIVDELFEGWYSSVVRYACRICGSIETAEDVVQESFMALYRELLRGQRIENAKGWTLCVVRREIIKCHRQRARHGGAYQALSDLQAEAAWPPAAHSPDDPHDELERLFGVLTTREREVFLLRIEGLRYGQIARNLGIGENSVKTLLARGLRRMKQARSETPPMAGEASEHAIRERLQ